MAKAMRVDVVPIKYFAIVAGLSVFVLLGAVIFGATGKFAYFILIFVQRFVFALGHPVIILNFNLFRSRYFGSRGILRVSLL